MLEMRFEPISSVTHVEEAAAVAQISCLFAGDFLESDFYWDEDALLESYATALSDEGDDAEADYVRIEQSRGVQLAKERVLADVVTIIRERLTFLGDHSPFYLTTGGFLSRKPLNEIDGVGVAYLWLCLFDLTESENDYLQADDAELKKFRAAFDKIFELISCYAIAGRTEQHTWYLGKNRSTKQFVGFLSRITRKAKSGSVKTMADLDANQADVNDAGVDGIGLTLSAGKVLNDAELILVQATIQKTNRRIKIMGQDALRRFKSFFVKRPLAAAKGALAIPYAGTAIDEAHCAEQDCIYITRDELYRYIGRHPVPGPRSGDRQLDTAMLKLTDKYRPNAKLLSVDGALELI